MRANNLDLLRLAAALGVILSHAFPLARGGDWAEPVFRISGGQTTLGHACVLTFFGLSGFLITASFQRSGGARRFVLARALRILPGLAVVLLCTAFVIGPLAGRLGLGTYLLDPAPYAYVADGLLFRFRGELPGVFGDVPFPRAVNGSLWTLSFEVACYLVVLALGVTRLLRLPVLVPIVLVLAGMVRFWVGGSATILGLPFAAGALLQLSGLRLRGDVAALCALSCAASLLTRGFDLVFGLLGTYLVLAVGLAPARLVRDLRGRVGDLSYGTYLWAFPVEQTAAQLLGRDVTWWGILLLATPPTLLLAWLSWHLVERPCEALRWRLDRGGAPSSLPGKARAAG